MEPYKIKHQDGVVEEGSVGTFVGSDGCNSLNGKYSYMSAFAAVEELTIETAMKCQDADTWLSTFSTAEIVGDDLVVYGPDGEEMGRLPRGR